RPAGAQPGRPGAHLQPYGRQHLPGLDGVESALSVATGARLGRLPNAAAWPLSVWRRGASRRRRHGRCRCQCRPGHPALRLIARCRMDQSPIECISAVTLATPDMARAVRFYRSLGFTILYGGETASFTSFSVGQGYLNLITQPADRRWSWWGRLIFHVADVD